MSDLYCHLCVMAGWPVGERFTTRDDADGRVKMRGHVLEPHPAQRLRSAVPGGEPVDIALVDGDAS